MEEAKVQEQSILRIGDAAPNFTADTSQGKLEFHKFIEGKWAILFSHPKDFTPVCATELGRVAQLKEEWEKRSVVVAGLSVDTVENHKAWIQDIEAISKTKVEYPIIADPDRKIAMAWGMLDQNHLSAKGLPLTVRSVFIINPSKTVQLILTYPAPVGRNFAEIIRCVDALQMVVNHKCATPVDWNDGKDCVVLPSVSTEDAKKLFPKGVNEVRPWLRMTPDPR